MKLKFLHFLFILICSDLLFTCKTLAYSDNTTKILKRGKRYLDLLKNSRMFFRANVKNNVIQVNQLWAHSYGFRANYPIENGDKSKRPFRRDVYEATEDLLDQHGFDGRACVLKSFCSAKDSSQTETGGGMLFKLFKMIFTVQDHEKHHFPYLQDENCEQILHHHCPFSFNSISTYTDDV